MLPLAEYAAERGGVIPCVYNASNEIAAGLFLEEKIKFTEMSRLIERALQSSDYQLKPSLDNLIATDCATRRMVEGWI